MPGISVLLICDHRRWWRENHHAPKRGDRVWCDACSDMRDVVGRDGEWTVTCQDCRYSRTYSTEPALERNVRDHLRNRPAHRITVGQIGTDSEVSVTVVPVDRTTLDETEAMF